MQICVFSDRFLIKVSFIGARTVPSPSNSPKTFVSCLWHNCKIIVLHSQARESCHIINDTHIFPNITSGKFRDIVEATSRKSGFQSFHFSSNTT
ncbi:hypothetical protein M0812_26086 [Anaeramoeba flamelloides]|uniref:Uncharacterized protein n=1 Tax=Anaeramoeba flamelloides TaxID=1746091 RepID=A0AAV7YCP8_9EUKA|nr:hypothetical protein M0812_26086 [Anaeramoeba flamelloides]